ncbi:MAG: hypothetical protein MJA27_16870 [Pseudanabaenales cyanobacterium]|nr:hypothetical protein [Pseudanabaenales cyanobacterium]
MHICLQFKWMEMLAAQSLQKAARREWHGNLEQRDNQLWEFDPESAEDSRNTVN